ncbi:hypothetical protein H8356DRAFT_1030318 [Neocallimastix lanati (nom. inval.)]|nr:hypothetical protein H8356DRAFT_1030318 [Neocallimastix sp. JGI-2020a]
MYSLNLLSCLILLVLGSIYVLTKPLSIGNTVPTDGNTDPTDANTLAFPDKIFLDDIALALVQNFDEESSSDDEGLIFDEGVVPADNTAGAAGAAAGKTGSNGSIIGSNSGKTNGNDNVSGTPKPVSGNNNNGNVSGTPKPGVVTAPDGTTTDLSNSTIKDGKVVDSKGNTVGTVGNDGKITDSKGNTVGTVSDGKIVDNNGNTVANVGNDGKVAPVAPVSGNNNNGNVSGTPKPGVVTAPDGTTTDFSNSTIKDNKVVDSNGNTIANVDKNGNIVDNKGNTVANLDPNGNITDNNGNTVANVDNNGNVNAAPVGNTVNNQAPEIIDQNARDSKNSKGGSVLYYTLPILGLVGGAGAFLYKNKYLDDVIGKTPSNETVTEMSNVGRPGDAPTAAAVGPNGGSTTTNSKTVYGSQLPYDVVNANQAGPSTTTTTTTTTRYGNGPKAATAAPVNTASNIGREQDISGGALPTIESGPSMDTLIKDQYTSPINENKSGDIGILPAVLAAGATAGAVAASKDPKKTTKTTTKTTYYTNNAPTTETIYETRYGPAGPIKDVKNVQSSTSPKKNITSTTKYIYPAADRPFTTSTTKTYTTNNAPSTETTTYENRYGPSTSGKTTKTTTTTTTKNSFDPKYMAAAAPLAAGAALAASKKKSEKEKPKTVKEMVNSYNTISNKEKVLPVVPGKKTNDEEIVEEYIVEHGKKSPKKTVKRTVYKTIYRNGVPVQVPVEEGDSSSPKDLSTGSESPEEIVEEYIIEEDSKKPKKTTKKTITTYKTIYRNGVPVQVPVTKEVDGPVVAETKEATNPYMGMVPMIIETIVKHSTPLGDKAEDEKKNDLKKLISKVTEINPDSKEQVETYLLKNKGPKKTVKRTVYKTIYRNGVPVQVPVDEEVSETSETSSKSMKSPKLKGLKKRITTYVTKDGKEVPVTEEFSLNPKDVSPEELPEEYKEFSSEEIVVPTSKSPKQKTIKKYITVYKTIYKNGKPQEVVENIEVPEGKTPEEVLASLPRDTRVKPTNNDKIEKRYVTSNVIEPPTKESVAEERVVKPTTVKSPKIHSVKKFVTTYKTTYKNGVPVEEVTESEDLPDQSTTEKTYSPNDTTTLEEENIKSPKLKTIKKVTTYKTIYKNGVPVEVVEEEPEEIVLEAYPALVDQSNVVPPEEDSEETLIKSPKYTGKKLTPGKKGLPEEKVEEYVLVNGVKKPKKTIKKTIYKTIYKNGVPVQVPVEVDERNVPVKDGKDTEEVVEEYVIENGVKKPKKTIKKTIYKTIYKNGVPVKVPVEETETKTKKIVKKAPTTTGDDLEEIIEEYIIEEGEDGKPKKTVKRTTYRNGVPVAEEYDEVDEIPKDAMETEEVVEEYEIEEGKNQPPKTLKKTVYKTIYQNGVPVKVPVSVEDQSTTRDIGSNPYMKLAPSVIETIVKYALPNAKDNDSKADLDNLLGQVTNITKDATAPQSNDRGFVSDMVTHAVANKITNSITGGNNDNPYMKLAPSIIETIVKYALPNAKDNDSKADLDNLLGQVTNITKLLGSREAPENQTRDATAPQSNDRGFVSDMVTHAVANKITNSITGGNNDNPYMKLAPSIIETIVKYALPNAKDNDSKADLDNLLGQVTNITKLLGSREAPEGQTREISKDGEEIVEEYLIEEGEDGKPKKTVKRTTYRNGVPVHEEFDEVSEIPDDAMETEEVVEEYEIEEGKEKTLKKTVFKNGVQVSEESTTEGKPNFRFRIPPSEGIRTIDGEEYEYEYEALPSITEEDESQPMEDNRMMETTSSTEARNFRKRQLPKRSSSKRLSAELKAAVIAEIAKLENEINEETKYIPQPRKQSISQGIERKTSRKQSMPQSLERKESKQSIKAMAEGCLVRKPSNASSIRSNYSVEDWSGPVFEKKVFEVILEHTPQLPDEVKLNLGDLVEVKQVFEDGWAYGINTATKVDGTFPVICLGEEREPNKNGRYVPRLIRVFQAREEAGKKEIEDEEKFKQDLTEFAKKKKEYKLKKQHKHSSKQ